MTTPPDSLEHSWERRLHEELRQLPEMEAPASLVPNVMAAIRARQEAAAVAWYRRPATTWPPALRIALGVSALAVFALLVLGGHLLWPQITASADAGALAAAGQKLGAIWSIASTLANAFMLVLRQCLSSPWFIGALVFTCFSYLTLLGAGSALWRAALHANRP
jgi:hypothetical protein